MSGTIRKFLASSTQMSANDLVEALDLVPREKRLWQPVDSARSALDQFTECAILNGNTADLIEQRSGKPFSYGDEFLRIRQSLLRDEPAARALLTENTDRVIAGLASIPDDAWDEAIPLPWGSITLRELAAYPWWNMVYHTGQIHYLTSLLKDSDNAIRGT